MTDSVQEQHVRARSRRRITWMGVTAAAVTLAAVFAAMALAASPATIDSASNSMLKEKVLVNSKGRTLYVLSPETAKHLLCTSSECLKFWPPLTVPSRSTKLEKASGVHGKMGILRRSNGMLQVTLNGLPLYRFAEDHASGEVNGQNFKGFGGIWHVLSDAGSPSSATPTASTPTTSTPTTSTPTTSTPSMTTPGYEY